jgi:hypothetical protein
VVLEDLFLLLLGGAVRPVPLRLRDGVPGVRRECELGVCNILELVCMYEYVISKTFYEFVCS